MNVRLKEQVQIPSLPMRVTVSPWASDLASLNLSLQRSEKGGEIGGSGVHFPSTPVKHLAGLRNRANSQWYCSIDEDQRPKIEDIKRLDGKKSA